MPCLKSAGLVAAHFGAAVSASTPEMIRQLDKEAKRLGGASTTPD
jgi:hypothetical protein